MLNCEPKYKENCISDNFFIPLSNQHFNKGLKELKSSEFRTYIGITYLTKRIGPDNSKYFVATKKALQKELKCFFKCSDKTFYTHIKKISSLDLIDVQQNNNLTINIGYNFETSKKTGFTKIHVNHLEYLLGELSSNELKLYLTIWRLIIGFEKHRNKRYRVLSYKLLKSWSGIKKKCILNDARDSLVKKGLINLSVNHNKAFIYKLKKLKEEGVDHKKEVKKSPLKEEKSPVLCFVQEKKLPHIKKSSFFKKKYKSKKGFSDNELRKVCLLLNNNYKTTNMNDKEKHELGLLLIEDEELNGTVAKPDKNGAYRSDEVKFPISYLLRESEEYGRVIDKVQQFPL